VTLDPERISRYARQLVIPGMGHEGQERLAAARVRAVGASGAAAPGLLYLTLAGVGTVWVDDPESVGPSDVAHWLYPPTTLGEPRARIAAEGLQERSRFVRVLSAAPAEPPTAALIIATKAATAVVDAERARKAGLPHVVAELDGEGGTVVTVPVGAPCYACSRSVGGAWRPAVAGAASVATLAAQELILLLADPAGASGRRVLVTRGVPAARPTARLAGCACGADIAR
jgi:adenylyltransferase/sulfurtransferase